VTPILTAISYIKLSDLARRVEDVIKQNFGSEFHWIVAEISSHKFYPGQDRHYFDFVEKAEGSNEPLAKIKGVAWAAGSQSIHAFEAGTSQKFTNGIQVLAKVKVEFHKAHGFSLVLYEIDQSFTLGNLEKQRQETLHKLVVENPDAVIKIGEEYLTRNKRLQLNTVIQNIAVVGSPNSEGYTDFTHTIANNRFHYKFSVDIYQSAVQGPLAENELISKLIYIFESGKKYDSVVIIRGGGARTDFLVFDSYRLARTAARFPIPIITGIGHHKDVSIVDLMVHTSTKTPTKAAEFIISHNRAFEDQLMNIQKTVIIKSQQLLAHAFQKINDTNLLIINKSRTVISENKELLNEHKEVIINRTKTILYKRQTNLVSLLNQLLSQPKIVIAHRRSELNNILSNLKVFSGKVLTHHSAYLAHYQSILKVMSPENILRKGFAIVSLKGKIITSGEEIKQGDELTVLMDKHTINTQVIKKQKRDEGNINL
jgi:exodeoxyribonuclease VII large subunit